MSPGSPSPLRRSPLHDEHVALGARMTSFGGFEMPLSYPAGTLAEHLACRRGAALFDVSHLGQVRLAGPGSFDTLQSQLTNDLRRIAPGRAQYQHLLDEDGSVLDDLIVWWVGDDAFEVVPNASNTSRVLAAIGGVDVTSSRALLAVQGPRARQVLAATLPDAASVPRFAVAATRSDGADLLVAGTGYTGEDGVEIAVPAGHAARLWKALLDAGADPAGLGARDTLRLEAGLPLHSHELGPGITPLQAGLGWVVSWDKAPFPGREALEAERATGVRRRLRGLLADGRQPLHAGDTCELDGGGPGTVTSGSYSPVLERGIGLAFLPPQAEPGARASVAVRGRRVGATVVKPPFHRLDRAAPRS
jgi:aminomethyltransferase